MAIKFDDVVLFSRTGLNPRDNFKLGQGDNHYITIKNIKNNKLVIDENTDVVDDEAIKLIHKRSQIKKGDILFCSIGRIGDMYIIENEPVGWDINESVFAFTLNTDIIRQKYFYYFFKVQSTLDYLSSNSSGSTFKSIKMNQLKKMEFNVPSLQEQDRIVYALDKVSKIIDARKSELAQLDNLIKSRFVEMFGDMTLNPNDWEVLPLGQVCDVRDGTHDSPKYYIEGYPLVTSKNVTGGKINFTDCSLICEEDYNKINERSKVDFGDILMPMIGTVGKPLIVDVDAEFAIKNVALIKFYEDSKVTNIFVKELLQSDYFDRAVTSKIRGGTQKFIALGDIRKLEICLPPIEVQKQFATSVLQVDKLKFLNTNKLSIYNIKE